MDDALFSDQPAPKDDSLFSNEPAPSAIKEMGRNILPNAEEIGEGAVSTAARIGKGVMDLPSDVAETAGGEWKHLLKGENPMEGITKSPIAQDVKTVGGGAIDAVAGIPEQFKNLFSKSEWVQHPVSNAMSAAAVAMPFLAPEEEGMAASIGRGMEKKGANMAADIADVSGKTVQKIRPETLGPEAEANIRMAGKTPNVADIRTEVGKKLVDEDIVGGVGQDVGDRLQQANEKREIAGKNVRSSIASLKNVGAEESVDAKTVLNPLLSKWAELGDSSIPGTARPYGDMYTRLEKISSANNGRLTFDDIDAELHDPGLKEALKKAPESKGYESAKTKYAILAGARDNIVEQIAKQAGNPELAKKLINANREYSLYSKISHDLTSPAASGETGGAPNPNRALYRGSFGRAALYSGIRAIKPALAEALVKGGPTVAKYGGVLEAAAKKGPQNLAIADFVLRQQHPDYSRAVQEVK